MIQILEISNPFEPNKREVKELYYTGGRLTDYIDIKGKDICIDGHVIEHPEQFTPLDGMQIIVTPHIAGKGVKQVLGLVAMVALSVYSSGVAGGAWGTFATTGSHFLAAGTFSAYLASGAVMFLGGKLINAFYVFSVFVLLSEDEVSFCIPIHSKGDFSLILVEAMTMQLLKLRIIDDGDQ